MKYPVVHFEFLEHHHKEEYLNLVSFFGDSKLSDKHWNVWYEIYSESDKQIIVGFVDDVNHGKIMVCTAALLCENKAFHQMGLAGHIEDVVVHQNFRRLGIGKVLMRHMISLANQMGCYKLILNCSQDNIQFYQSLGFKLHETGMKLTL